MKRLPKKTSEKIVKKIDVLNPSMGPLSKNVLVEVFGCTYWEYSLWRTKNDGKEVLRKLDAVILQSLYEWGMDPKIKNPRVIELFIDNEIPKSSTGIKLEIINDISEWQKQLQPFDINNKRIDIENKRDKIVVIPDKTTDELVEMIEGDEDA